MTTTSRVDELTAATSITGDDLLLVIDGATTAKKITAANTLTYWEAAGTAAALADDLSGVSDASTARSNLAAAPNTPSFIVLGTNSELTNERVLTAGTNITFTDGGAGGNLTIDAGGGSSYSTPAPLAASIKGYGLPGRPLVWGGTAMAQTVGYVFCDPFTVTESVDFDAYDFRADTGVASTLTDIAVFSCANWKVGTTMTKVASTETTGTSVATSGIKTPTLGATKTLTPGRYVLARVSYGGASATNWWYATSAQGYLGVRPADGTGAHQEGWVQASGASSLAASYTITNAATTTGVPVVLRRA